ncbi:MAG: family 78 glycoside hydrolase catalytic domain [Clostridia bacterium]|nr:family 78 glycoside hydrolase catalytic domain [Clostridia bacterium]
MKITNLLTNHIDRPLGFGFEKARLSWQVTEAAGSKAVCERIQVSLSPSDEAPIYDSGALNGALPDSSGWVLPMDLKPRTRYYWRVYVKDDLGDEAFSDWTWFETPKAADEAWQASWITSPFGRDCRPIFTKRFACAADVKKARLYLLGLGLYEAYLNGQKLGSEVLAPGFHAYDSYLMYQTLELSPVEGENVLEVWLGEGWYMGHYGLKPCAPKYGDKYALLAEIHLCHEGGSEEVFGTGEDWLVTRSPIRFDSIYDGETWDATLLPGDPRPALRMDAPKSPLGPRINPLIERHESFTPSLTRHFQVLDMGQNFAGWCEFDCDAPKGTVIRLLYGEYMRDGDIYRENLRAAKQEFVYVSDGVPRRVRPRFTYYGFRYVKVEGWPGTLDPKRFEGRAIYSSLRRTGEIITGNGQVNRLFLNTLWSLKSNFLDVPTDCPQRDERMGWTGDIQIFADTASYHMDTAAFLDKFMRDLRCEQMRLDGSVPCVVPMCRYELNGVAAWGDAACVIPWQLYLHTGDCDMLARQLPAMCDWVDWIHRHSMDKDSMYLWANSPQLGDWLALDGDSVYGGTDRTFVATAYFYYSAMLTAKAAGVLGKKDLQAKYQGIADSVKAAFQREYFTPSGRIAVRTQTACVMSLYLGLCPSNAIQPTAWLLEQLLHENGCALSTGFVGTPWLLPVLCDHGLQALAYDLLLRQDFPSWMYELNNGATTIWERWNSIEPDGSMNKDGMNSFNHYAYGSVAGWMYRYAMGLSPVEEEPGFRRVRFAPKPDPRIGSVSAAFESPCGTYKVQWHFADGQWRCQLTIPFGCAADVTLPDGKECTLCAGTHELICPFGKRYHSLDSSLDALLADSKTRAVILEYFPKALKGIPFQYEMHTMRQLVSSPFAEISASEVEALDEALKKCEI